MAKIFTIRPPARGVLPSSMGFKYAVFVDPGESLAAKYNWLKSSDRDTRMGAASATNRRTLILAPGVYTLSVTWTLDTDYVDVVSLSGNPKDTIITRATGDATVVQTADDVRLIGFTIKNTGNASGDHGFEINASDNSDSFYEDMHFRQTSVAGTRTPVYGVSDLNGTWRHCEADNFAWRLATNKNLSATMEHCVAGESSFGGDASGAEITGTLRYCVAGRESFGGCDVVGCDISGTLEYCIAGDRSFALGKEFSGMAIGCIGGRCCFAGWSGVGANYGTFSGKARNCTAEGGYSFGMGHASCVQSGTIENCRNGTAGLYAEGVSGAAPSTITDNGAKAALTTDCSPANGEITITAKHNGEWGNDIAARIYWSSPAAVNMSAGDELGFQFDCLGYSKTANEMKALADANTDFTRVATVAVEGTGAGLLGADESAPAVAMEWTNLTDGADSPFFAGNQPWVPSVCTANTPVYPFDNGHVYTNEGAGGAITFSLPAALPGLEYRFVVMTAQQLRLDPNGSDTIAINGTQQAAGKYIVADAVGEACLLKCVKAGQWEQFDPLGTWTAEE